MELTDQGSTTLMIEVLEGSSARPKLLGTATLDLLELPWESQHVHRLSLPFHHTNGSVTVTVEAVSADTLWEWAANRRDVSTTTPHTPDNNNNNRSFNHRSSFAHNNTRSNAAMPSSPYSDRRSPAPAVAASPSFHRPSSRIEDPFEMQNSSASRFNHRVRPTSMPIVETPSEEDDLSVEEYISTAHSSAPLSRPSRPSRAVGVLQLTMLVVRFVRGPKGFLTNGGRLFLVVRVAPKHSLGVPPAVVRTSAQERGAILTWADTIEVDIFEPPCEAQLLLCTRDDTGGGGDVVLGEGEFDLPAFDTHRKYLQHTLDTSAALQTHGKRLHTELSLEYNVEYHR
eukprot:NODE_692_length_1413_cov_208.231672_g525_i0.p1 GENE.NODE_692_length_1413_cov_208.231672_g525_i0~~NODE_692_length_1413_cov_208.231672_g525_i0.p1  ORF type:complete len:341 (-),score=72.60 NODE_692_length_1413_cov_208.231672_g525_i0:128-1150(-)